MSRLLKPLPDDVRLMIREYASDKCGPYSNSTAPLISCLQFSQVSPVNHPLRVVGNRTRVECDWGQMYFRQKSEFNNYGWRHSDMLQFHHKQFDERNFPWQFHPCLKWDNSCEQDEIEARAAEDTRLYPDGVPASLPPSWWWWSAKPRDAPVVHPLQWTRVGEGKWECERRASPLTPLDSIELTNSITKAV